VIQNVIVSNSDGGRWFSKSGRAGFVNLLGLQCDEDREEMQEW